MVLNTLQYRITAEDDTETALRQFGSNAERTFTEASDSAERVGEGLKQGLEDAVDEGVGDEVVGRVEGRLGGMFSRVAAAAGAALAGIFEGIDRYQTLMHEVELNLGGNITAAEGDLLSTLGRTGDVTTDAATAAVGALRGQYGNLGLTTDNAGVPALFLASAENLEQGTARQLARLLNRFGVEGPADIASNLDLLYRQAAGAGVPLAEVLQAFEGDARALPSFGFDLPQSTELIVDALNAGLDFGAIGGGLEEARIVAAENGIDPITALQTFVRDIRRAPADQQFNLAVEYFGETDAHGVVEGIRSGQVGFGRELLVDSGRLSQGGLLRAVGLTDEMAGQAILDAGNFTNLSGQIGSGLLSGLSTEIPGTGFAPLAPLVNRVAEALFATRPDITTGSGAVAAESGAGFTDRLYESEVELWAGDLAEYEDTYSEGRFAARDRLTRQIAERSWPSGDHTPEQLRRAQQLANEQLGIYIASRGGVPTEIATRGDDYAPPARPTKPTPVRIVADETPEEGEPPQLQVKLAPQSIEEMASIFATSIAGFVPDPTRPNPTSTDTAPPRGFGSPAGSAAFYRPPNAR